MSQNAANVNLRIVDTLHLAMKSLRRFFVALILLVFFSLLLSSFAVVASENTLAENGDDISRVISANSSLQTDNKIRLRLEEIYQNVPGLAEIEVRVNQGVVTLSGEVSDKKLAHQANTLASRMDNAVLLDSQLTLSTDVQFRLETLQSKAKSYSEFIL